MSAGINFPDLAECEAEFRALADNMSQLAWMTDPDGLAY
jgi:hypothetical protein